MLHFFNHAHFLNFKFKNKLKMNTIMRNIKKITYFNNLNNYKNFKKINLYRFKKTQNISMDEKTIGTMEEANLLDKREKYWFI